MTPELAALIDRIVDEECGVSLAPLTGTVDLGTEELQLVGMLDAVRDERLRDLVALYAIKGWKL